MKTALAVVALFTKHLIMDGTRVDATLTIGGGGVGEGQYRSVALGSSNKLLMLLTEETCNMLLAL